MSHQSLGKPAVSTFETPCTANAPQRTTTSHLLLRTSNLTPCNNKIKIATWQKLNQQLSIYCIASIRLFILCVSPEDAVLLRSKYNKTGSSILRYGKREHPSASCKHSCFTTTRTVILFTICSVSATEMPFSIRDNALIELLRGWGRAEGELNMRD